MSAKKITVSFLLIFVVFVSLAVPSIAFAQTCEQLLYVPPFNFSFVCSLIDLGGLGLDDIATDFIRGLARLIVSGIIYALGSLFFAVAFLANWVVVNVIDIGVSPNAFGTPDFVKNGWEFSRNFVNIFFLLILVFIGLATILRLREYELQRTLPKLIIIVLLVNFSGLLVGFLADIGNITTIFFTESIYGQPGAGFGSDAGGNDQFTPIFEAALERTGEAFEQKEALEAFGLGIGLSIAFGFFFIFAILAFLAITIVFFLRLVILWVLVILAPFAFLFYILPITRQWWNRWLSALIQWSFITVPLAFFMWLAQQILINPISSLSPTAGEFGATGDADRFSELFGAMLSPFVAIVLLFIGLGMSASMSGFIRGGLRFARHAGAVAVGVAGGKAAYDFFRKRAAESKILRRMETATSANAGSRLGRWAGRPLNPLARAIGRRTRGAAQKSIDAEVKRETAAINDKNTELLTSEMHGNLSTAQKIARLNKIIEREDIDDAMDMGLSENEITKVRRDARRFNQHREIDAAMPHLVTDDDLARRYAARRLNINEDEVTRLQMSSVNPDQIAQERDRMYRRIRPDRAKRMSGGMFARDEVTDALEHPEDVEALVRNFNGTRVGNIASADQGQEAAESIQRAIREQFTAFQNAVTTDPAIGAAVTAPGAPTLSTTPLEWLRFQPTAAQYPTLTDAQRRIIGGNNPALARWMQTQAGQQLGFTLL